MKKLKTNIKTMILIKCRENEAKKVMEDAEKLKSSIFPKLT